MKIKKLVLLLLCLTVMQQQSLAMDTDKKPQPVDHVAAKLLLGQLVTSRDYTATVQAQKSKFISSISKYKLETLQHLLASDIPLPLYSDNLIMAEHVVKQTSDSNTSTAYEILALLYSFDWYIALIDTNLTNNKKILIRPISGINFSGTNLDEALIIKHHIYFSSPDLANCREALPTGPKDFVFYRQLQDRFHQLHAIYFLRVHLQEEISKLDYKRYQTLQSLFRSPKQTDQELLQGYNLQLTGQATKLGWQQQEKLLSFVYKKKATNMYPLFI